MAEHDSPPSADEKLILASPDAAKTPRDFALWIGVLALALFTIYSRALPGKYLWDDDRHVTENALLRSPAGLEKIWFALRSPYMPQYYPLTHTTYWIEYQLVGADETGLPNPMIFHITNVILHAVGAALLWFVLRKLAVPGAWVAAAAWALHPVQVETVAWISERKNVLSGVFFFGSILAWLESNVARDDESKSVFDERYWISLLLFVLGLLSKTVICSMPAVALLLIWWKRGRISARQWLGAAPFFVIGIAMAALTSWLEVTHVRAAGPDWELSFAKHILLAGCAVWFYARQLFWPHRLMFIYPKWDLPHALPWWWLGPIAVVAVLAVLWLLRRRIGRAPFIAAAIYVGMLVPAMGFFNLYPMRYSYVADHFQYHASAALIAFAVAGGARMVSRMTKARHEPSPAPYIAAGALLAVLAGTTFVRGGVFAGPIPLWRDTLAKNPGAWMAHNNLGFDLYLEALSEPHPPDELLAMLDDAERHFAEAVKLRPRHERAYMNWGTLLLTRGNYVEAQQKFEQQLLVAPDDIDALTGLGKALTQQKKFPEAAARFREAADLADASPYGSRAAKANTHALLAQALAATSDTKAALVQCDIALQLKDNSPAAHLAHARVLAQLDRRNEAAAEYANVIRLQMNSVEARVELASLMMRVPNLGGAHTLLMEAAQLLQASPIDPTSGQIYEVTAQWARLYAAATRPATTRSTTTRSTTTRATTVITR